MEETGPFAPEAVRGWIAGYFEGTRREIHYRHAGVVDSRVISQS